MIQLGSKIEAAAFVQQAFDRAGIPFCVIGGIANLRWGNPRLTNDVDLVILCPAGQELAILAKLEAMLPPRPEHSTDFARVARIYLGMTPDGTPVDVSRGASLYETDVISRSSLFELLPRRFVRTCSAEDLVILKAFACRDIDRHDLVGILHRQHGALDWALIDRELGALAELRDDVDVAGEFLRIRKQVGA